MSTVLTESKCFLTALSKKVAFSWPSTKIAQLQMKNSEKSYHMCIFPITADNKTKEKNVAHTNCGFRRMLASQVLMSGDNTTLSCFQIVFCLGNFVSESPLKTPRPL